MLKKCSKPGDREDRKALSLPDASRYPKHIYYANERYKLIFVKNLRGYGLTNWATKVVKIRAGMSRRATFITIIHELLHIIEFETPVKLKHKTVYKLEQAISEMLLDNFI